MVWQVPKLNVYVPEELAAAVREAGISISPVCQQALEREVQRVRSAQGSAAALRFTNAEFVAQAGLSADLAERMTPRLRNVVVAANQIARPLDEPVDDLHLLIALLDEPGNLGSLLLLTVGVNPLTVRRAAERAAGLEGRARDLELDDDQLLAGLSFEGRQVFARAVEAAAELGHDYLGCEHLLLGIAGDPIRGAGALLATRGATASILRRALPGLVAAAGRGPAGDPADVVARLDAIEARLTEAGL